MQETTLPALGALERPEGGTRMASDPTVPRTRRAVLAAGAAAAVATVAKSVVGPEPAAALDQPPLLANAHNAITSTTYFTGVNPSAFRILDVDGKGLSLSTRATEATTIIAESGSMDTAAVVVLAEAGSTGLLAFSGQFPGDVVPSARAETGVYGVAYGGETSAGVLGQAFNGTGVEAQSTDGIGLHATSTNFIAIKGETTTGFAAIWGAHHAGGNGVEGGSVSGIGVKGYATTGTGVRAESPSGKALRVEGKASFSRSGRKSISANRSYVDVDLSGLGGIGSSSLCFANLAVYRSGVWVAAVRPNYPSAGRMRIYLNKVASTTSSTSIAWLVLD